MASQLARLLPGCGLDRLTDDECAALVEHINNLTDEASDLAFKEGWDSAQVYTNDPRLLSAGGPVMNH